MGNLDNFDSDKFFSGANKISNDELYAKYPNASKAQEEIYQFEWNENGADDEFDSYEEFESASNSYNSFYVNPEYPNVVINNYNDGYAGATFGFIENESKEWEDI